MSARIHPTVRVEQTTTSGGVAFAKKREARALALAGFSRGVSLN